MTLEPWMVRTGMVILSVNVVNLFLYLVARKLHEPTRISASIDTETPVTDRQRTAA